MLYEVITVSVTPATFPWQVPQRPSLLSVPTWTAVVNQFGDQLLPSYNFV